MDFALVREGKKALAAAMRREVPAINALGIGAVHAELLAVLARADAAAGWDPGSGLAHPDGGYTERSIDVNVRSSNMNVVVSHRDADGEAHRDDGPAIYAYDQRGDVSYVSHDVHGVTHRDDGPATLRPDGEPTFSHQGEHVTIRPEGPFGDSRAYAAPIERYHLLTGAGVSAKEATAWLRYEQDAGYRSADDLIEAGVGAQVALACASAGVEDTEAIAAVARGELPMSWAVAGR